ncbi:hypothetical protein [Oceanobacillus chungangensis]|uniref:hypothetical protein n=1 Tax=Oceanobacillus chungangensis TaxID=1229152 RepID=UPI003CCC621B
MGHLFYSIGFLTNWKFSKFRFLMLVPITLYGFSLGKMLVGSLHSTGLDVAYSNSILFSFLSWHGQQS